MADCTKAEFVTGGKCLTESVWSQKEQDALIVYLLADLLKTTGGTDYTEVLATTLISDAYTQTCGLSKDQREAAFIAIIKAFSGNAQTTDQLATEIKCLRSATSLQLEEAKLFLACKLSNALTYLT
jgi:hypothetical protein